jgi:ferredoxin
MFRRLFSDPTRWMDTKTGTLKGSCFSPPPEAERPTYEVAGEIERYDQRNTPFSRFPLRPESPKYEEYYSKHPELREVDDGWRERASRSRARSLRDRPVNVHLESCGFHGVGVFSRPDMLGADVRPPTRVTGQEDPARLELSPEDMAAKLKALGLQLGAGRVRVGRLNQDWVYSHTGLPFDGQPVDLDYENIICMAIPQDPFLIDVGSGVAGALEVGWKYSLGALISGTIASFIRRLGWRARPLPAGNAPYLVVPTFVDAGIGEFSRCGFVVTKEFGNNWRPGAVATDLPLAVDKPVDFGLQDFCEKCKICAVTCPARAIPQGDKEVVRGVRRWDVDGDQCFTYWQTTGRTCAVCQAVCPWNHRNSLFHNTIREAAQRVPWLRSALVKGEELFYRSQGNGPEPEWIRQSPA